MGVKHLIFASFFVASVQASGIYGSYLVRTRTVVAPKAPGASGGQAAALRAQNQLSLSGLTGFLDSHSGAVQTQAVGPRSAQSTGVRSYSRFWAVPVVAVTCRHDFVEALRNQPDVVEVIPDHTVTLQVSDPVSETSAASADYRGSLRPGPAPVRLGVIDSGIVAHPAFSDRIVAYRDFTENPQVAMTDTVGHGSHVASLLAGGRVGNDALGVFPSGELVIARALEIISTRGETAAVQGRVQAFASRILQAMQWMLDPDENPQTDDFPKIIVNSWGFTEAMPLGRNFFDDALKSWSEAGIVAFFAAGNEGRQGIGTIRYPGNSSLVITIGSVNNDKQLSDFSSKGGNEERKPDFVFFGEQQLGIGRGSTGAGLVRMSGSSMATPLVAGLAAYLLSHSPSMSRETLYNALKTAAEDLGPGGFDTMYGHGLINPQGLTQVVQSHSDPISAALAGYSHCQEVALAANPCSSHRQVIIQYFSEMSEANQFLKLNNLVQKMKPNTALMADGKLRQQIKQILRYHMLQDPQGAANHVYSSLYADQ